MNRKTLEDFFQKYLDDPFTDGPFALRGAEEGYNQFSDVITQSIDGADLNAMWREFQASVALLNSQRNGLINALTFQVGNPVERVMLPSEEDFELASEFGEPVGVRLGVPFVAGYDFNWYDIGTRYTWLFLAESDAQQIRAINSEVLEADVRLQFLQVFKTIFNNANSSATINQQNVNVYRFYNADGFVPPPYKGTTFTGSHTHYLASGAGTIDSGDLTAMEDTLWEHGYRLSKGYKLVLLVNRQEGKVIRSFKRPTDPYDFIPGSNVGGGIFLPASMGVVGAPGGEAAIEGTIGTYGPWIVVEEDYVPAGYVLGLVSGGESNIGNPVGIRQHARPELRGLRLMPGPGRDYPLTEAFYQHGLGTGIRHRGAGVVMKITAGSYTVPTQYA
jgi:hypothetical protein